MGGMLGAIKNSSSLGLLILAFVFSIPLVVLSVAAWFSNPENRRFSLRTLLIATTLIALVLGLIVWLR
jgi:cyanate permease